MELRATALWMSGVGPEAEGRVEFTILLERAISGDVSAFEQIILRYERRVFSLAWRLLGKPEDAQDASQEVFLRAFRYLHRFDRHRPFEPWLMKMTVNVCHDLSKKRHAQPQGVINPDVLRAAGDPHHELHTEQQRTILYKALQELPEKERAAIVLRDIEGLSTAEVAEILGSSEATVRSQISSARLKIKKAVKRGRV
jgi:RNA polymerase sigma-70 factor (ECF subfamily)